MADFDPAPSDTALADEHAAWAEGQDTRARIRAVITGLHEPTTVTDVADRANCSPNAARKHLTEFVELGVAQERVAETGTRYVRNDAYFRWRRANELATTQTVEQLLADLRELESQDEQYKTNFEYETPADVPLPEDATHAELEQRLQTLSEWQTVRKSISRYKQALRIAREQDDELTA